MRLLLYWALGLALIPALSQVRVPLGGERGNDLGSAVNPALGNVTTPRCVCIIEPHVEMQADPAALPGSPGTEGGAGSSEPRPFRKGTVTAPPSSYALAAGPPSPQQPTGEGCVSPPLPIHPLRAQAERWEAEAVKRGVSTRSLYLRAVSLGVPIRWGRFTKYHPKERSGLGGGWGTADGQGFRPGCIASSTRHYRFWRGHELWVEGYGRSVIGDNGPGWTSRYQFDLAAFSAAEVDKLDRGPGIESRRYVVIRCPRPETCSCDYAKAWRGED